MRILLKIMKWLAISIVALIFVLAALPWFPVLQDKLSEGKEVAYLEANHVSLNLDQPDGSK